MSKNITAYRLAKEAGVSYSCVSDLCLGKTATKNLTLEKACRIADYLGIEPASLLELRTVDCVPFRYFRNDLLSSLKRLGDDAFSDEVVRKRLVDYYHKNQDLPKALYLLALLEHLGRRGKKYAKISALRLKKPFFVGGKPDMFSSLAEAEKAMGAPVIAEFAKYNIVEVSIRDVA